MTDPCPHERRLESIERRHDVLQDYLKKMEDKFDTKLDLILMQLNKVAILEEKHSYQSAALERAFGKIAMLDEAIDKLSSFKDRTEGMAKMAYLLWSAMGISLATIVYKVFGQ